MASLTRGFTMLAAACAATIGAGTASAQSVSGSIRDANNANADIFARDRAVTVRERPRPDYEALGLPLGGFTVFPRAQIDFEYNDNVLATDGNEQDDLIFRFRPDVTVRSGWSRHAIAAFARSSMVGYSDLSGENTVDWTVGGSGRVDVARGTNFSAGADYGRLTEARTVTTQLLSEDPIRYELGSAYVAASTVRNRVKLSARADYRDFDYDDGRTTGGLLVEQDDRDRTVASLTGRVDYGVSPATAIFFQATANERDYRDDVIAGVPARDSSGYEVLVGTNLELGAVVRGELAVGYIEQTFDDAAYQNIDGFGARGELEWLPTELTTITLTGSRTIEDSGIVGSAGYLSTQFGARVDHELLRNVILTGTLTYTQDDFDDVDRTDDRWGAGLAGTYLLNRRLGITAAASHASRSSDGVGGQNYNVNRLMLTLVGQF